ncbi:hypothetical protein BGW42_006554 [Actinomortierella wolfii]|nr:hypothetical protein BGW42_006554 [Actinomortierella wolfii]
MESLVESMHKVMQQSDPLLYSLVSNTACRSSTEVLPVCASVDTALYPVSVDNPLSDQPASAYTCITGATVAPAATATNVKPSLSVSGRDPLLSGGNRQHQHQCHDNRGIPRTSSSMVSFSRPACTSSASSTENSEETATPVCRSGLPSTVKDWLLWMISQHATSLQPAPGLMLLDPIRYQPLDHHRDHHHHHQHRYQLHRSQTTHGAIGPTTGHDPVRPMDTHYFRQGAETTSSNGAASPAPTAGSATTATSATGNSNTTSAGGHQVFLNNPASSSAESNSRLQRGGTAAVGSNAKENHSSGSSSTPSLSSSSSATASTPSAATPVTSATSKVSASATTKTTTNNTPSTATPAQHTQQQQSSSTNTPPNTRPDAGYVRRQMAATLTSTWERASSITASTIQQELVVAKDKTFAFLYRTFSPTYRVGRLYIESWSNGTQRRGFERIRNNLLRGDAWTLTLNTTAHLKNIWHQVMAARRVSSSTSSTSNNSHAAGSRAGSTGIQRLARQEKEKDKDKATGKGDTSSKTSSSSSETIHANNNNNTNTESNHSNTSASSDTSASSSKSSNKDSNKQ